MKVIVCGTRGFDKDHLYAEFLKEYDSLIENNDDASELVHGACPDSPDQFAEHLGAADGIPQKPFPANWESHGRSAGFIRNAVMAEYVRDNGGGFCIAVWDGKSNGTKNMLEEATKAGIPSRIIPAKL